jgi:O-antigen/teichoic acid export membrane protein
LGALLVIVAAANSLDKIYFEPEVWPALLLAPSALLHYGLCQLCVASNRTGTLGMLRCLPYALCLVAAIILHALGLLTYGHAALCYTGGLSVSVIWGVVALRPRFDGLRQAWNDTRRCFRYGRDMYISRVSAMGVYKLDVPLIALFLDFESVGYYTLARAVLMPFCLVTQSFAATRYKQYMAGGNIPRFDLLAVYGYSAAAVLVPIVLSVTALPSFFGDKPAVFFFLVQILSLRVGIQSVSMIYNMYFTATGKSGLVLRVSIVTSVLNLILYLVCIPVFGVLGVAVADVLDCATYYLMLLRAYVRRRRVSTPEDPAEGTVHSRMPFAGAESKSVAA